MYVLTRKPFWKEPNLGLEFYVGYNTNFSPEYPNAKQFADHGDAQREMTTAVAHHVGMARIYIFELWADYGLASAQVVDRAENRDYFQY